MNSWLQSCYSSILSILSLIGASKEVFYSASLLQMIGSKIPAGIAGRHSSWSTSCSSSVLS